MSVELYAEVLRVTRNQDVCVCRFPINVNIELPMITREEDLLISESGKARETAQIRAHYRTEVNFLHHLHQHRIEESVGKFFKWADPDRVLRSFPGYIKSVTEPTHSNS